MCKRLRNPIKVQLQKNKLELKLPVVRSREDSDALRIVGHFVAIRFNFMASDDIICIIHKIKIVLLHYEHRGKNMC